MSAKPKSDYSIQTVSNALRMLESFRGEDELGVSELARGLQLHKNNAFRLLATLEEHGYIEQSTDNDRYRLGTRCLELGQVYIGSQSLLQRARPVLRELVLKVGETAHLAVLRDHEVVHLDGVQSRTFRYLGGNAVRLHQSLDLFRAQGVRRSSTRSSSQRDSNLGPVIMRSFG